MLAESFDAEQKPGKCERCGYMTSQPICKACHLLEGLNTGNPRLGLVKARGRHKVKPELEESSGLRAKNQVKGARGRRVTPSEVGEGSSQAHGSEVCCSGTCACSGKAGQNL
jgi:hypothetical protein